MIKCDNCFYLFEIDGNRVCAYHSGGVIDSYGKTYDELSLLFSKGFLCIRSPALAQFLMEKGVISH